jgi:NAD dependent epimerase/dehydratase family enzyme
MKVFMTGGTGFVGSNLTKRLTAQGHEVTVLTRSVKRSLPLPQGASYLEGNPLEKGAWQEKVSGQDGVINLAGASIFKRWTNAYKKELRDSRMLTTQNVVEALRSAIMDSVKMKSLMRRVLPVPVFSRRWLRSGNQRLSRQRGMVREWS